MISVGCVGPVAIKVIVLLRWSVLSAAATAAAIGVAVFHDSICSRTLMCNVLFCVFAIASNKR